MGRVINASEGLIDPAFDKFLDGHPTRRELQAAFNKMGKNDSELFGMVDTQALVGNFLCEKLGVTRAELEAYVAKKAEELKNLKAAQLAAEKDAKEKERSAECADMGTGTGSLTEGTAHTPSCVEAANEQFHS